MTYRSKKLSVALLGIFILQMAPAAQAAHEFVNIFQRNKLTTLGKKGSPMITWDENGQPTQNFSIEPAPNMLGKVVDPATRNAVPSTVAAPLGAYYLVKMLGGLGCLDLGGKSGAPLAGFIQWDCMPDDIHTNQMFQFEGWQNPGREISFRYQIRVAANWGMCLTAEDPDARINVGGYESFQLVQKPCIDLSRVRDVSDLKDDESLRQLWRIHNITDAGQIVGDFQGGLLHRR